MGHSHHAGEKASEGSGAAGRGGAGQRGWGRRRVLAAGLGGAAVLIAGGAAGVELVSRGVLPGKSMLDRIDGACSVAAARLEFAPPGPSFSGAFYSPARHRSVGYTIAYPPGHRPGDRLPLVVMLHGYGGNHAHALFRMSPAQALALRLGGRPLVPMAMVTVDGGNLYWNPHPGDDPMAMVIGELIPRCQRLGLGRPPQRMAIMGISMGGYGALLLAERYPHLFAAVAAISPAIWTSYPQARAVNVGAYASAAAFRADNAVTHAAAQSLPAAATPSPSSPSRNHPPSPSSPATSPPSTSVGTGPSTARGARRAALPGGGT